MNTPAPDILITPADLAQRLATWPPTILDCRFDLANPAWGRTSFMQGHIPGAVFMDVNLDLSSPVLPDVTGRHPLPHPEILQATLRAAGVQPHQPVVVYDQGNGMYAARAWWLLHWMGHTDVMVLDGGYAAWEREQLPVDNTWPAPAESRWTGRPNPAMVVSKEEVAQGPPQLVDSRDYRRYRGEFEPIDPVAGHIPGAVCIPYAENVREDGTWKSLPELQDRFRDLISAQGDAPPVFYCGSGVSACHNVLAYYLATGTMARLYAGSWSEWILYYPPAEADA